MKKLLDIGILSLGIIGLANGVTETQDVADLPSRHSIEIIELADLPSRHSIEPISTVEVADLPSRHVVDPNSGRA